MSPQAALQSVPMGHKMIHLLLRITTCCLIQFLDAFLNGGWPLGQHLGMSGITRMNLVSGLMIHAAAASNFSLEELCGIIGGVGNVGLVIKTSSARLYDV